jgi:hypothetical protein
VRRVPQTPVLRLGILTLLLISERYSSIPLIAFQLSISTIPCKCLYSLANPVLPSPMFSPPNHPASRPTPSFSFASPTTSLVPQILPTFSTAAKYAIRRNACNSIRFMPLLHNFRTLRGWGSPDQARHFFSSSFCFRIDPLTHSSTNSFRCNAYKKHGVRSTLLCASSAHSASPRYPFFFSQFFLPTRSIAPWLHRYLITSGHRIAALFSIQVRETHFLPLASHHLQAVPCGGSIQNQTSDTKYGGDCA